MALVEAKAAFQVGQALSSALSGNKLVIDGVWGKQSKAAYSRLDEATRREVDAVVASVNPDVKLETDTISAIAKMVVMLSNKYGAPAASMLAKAQTESGFNPLATNGIYRGMFQMGPPAWKEGRLHMLSSYGEDVGEFSVHWSDPRRNTIAAIGYRFVLAKQLRSAGYVTFPTEVDYYLAHQQGASGYTRLRKVADGVESLSKSDKDYKRVVGAMLSNPPHDDMGATTDPESFIERWSKVIDQRIDFASNVLLPKAQYA